jgi:hypothetical protein
MASPLHAANIREYLTTTTGLSNVYINQMNPATSNLNQYVVIEYPGLANVKTHGTGSPKTPVLDEANIQVLARHSNAQSARTAIRNVVDSLDGLNDVTVNSVLYTWIEMISAPRIHERDEQGNVTFIAEFRVQSRR